MKAKSGICGKCGIASNDVECHIKRNRCAAQHIRHDGSEPPRGKRLYHHPEDCQCRGCK